MTFSAKEELSSELEQKFEGQIFEIDCTMLALKALFCEKETATNCLREFGFIR